MSFPIFYFVGGEDVDFTQGASCSIDTGSGFRGSPWSRCALAVNNNPTTAAMWRSIKSFSVTSFWFGSQCVVNSGNSASGYPHWAMRSSDGVIRLQLNGLNIGSWQLFKINSAGSATQLGSNFTMPIGSSNSFNIQVNYSTSGSIAIWLGPILCFSFTGDVTTNGVTTLSEVDLGCGVAGNSGINTWWSEIVISDSDTRSMSLQTLPPVANGNTHNFDIGSPAASNVNEIVISDATLDGATTSGLIDQYTIPAVATGSYAIGAVAISARLNRGFVGPQHMELGVRSAGADYWDGDETLNASFTSGYQEIWNTDPSTSAAWAGLPTNIGLKAVA